MFSALNSLITSGSGVNLLIIMIVVPAIIALVTILIPKSSYFGRAIVFLLTTVINLLFAIALFVGEEMTLLIPWADFGINLSLRVYDFSQFMVLAAACFAFLVALYSISFMRNKSYSGKFFFYYLITLALVNGAFLANNLVVMLFFWEGLLVTLFGMTIIGNRKKPAVAMKALILNGVADLLLMFGIAITAMQADTMMMDMIMDIPMEGLGILGFVCMMLGAIGKAGSMPFHSWIPDAAEQAPLPFMAILPAALEKMLGIYLLVRVCLNFYDFVPGSTLSIVVMAIGAITLVLAVGMALIQKDMKKLLSYHAISQVGYMILGIGTALPVGIVGGIFHMINHVIYKCCLFLTAGSVEKQTGTTDLNKISGLGRFMPITAICFIVAALSISGVPPFNGFFSKELIFDAALESGVIFYIAAILGAFLTAASFLKLGHAAFFGPVKLPENVREKDMMEAPGAMLLPMIVLAVFCVIFGIGNAIPLSIIQPLLGDALGGANFAGWPHSIVLVLISIGVLLLALLNHYWGYRRTGAGLKAVDHIHYLPGLHQVYNCAEKHYFDPYNILMLIFKFISYVCFAIDRCINWIYDVLLVKTIQGTATAMKNFDSGSTSRYIAWMFTGMAFVLMMFILLI